MKRIDPFLTDKHPLATDRSRPAHQTHFRVCAAGKVDSPWMGEPSRGRITKTIGRVWTAAFPTPPATAGLVQWSR